VRRRGPPKQRLWLGTRQCCSGCRNATTNTAATNAYAYSDGDAMRAWNTYAYSNGYGHGYGNSNSDGYGNCNAYSERNTDADTNIYGHANRHAYRCAQGETKASSDSASSAVSTSLPACPQ
jgi:hypothetical protein